MLHEGDIRSRLLVSNEGDASSICFKSCEVSLKADVLRSLFHGAEGAAMPRRCLQNHTEKHGNLAMLPTKPTTVHDSKTKQVFLRAPSQCVGRGEARAARCRPQVLRT